MLKYKIVKQHVINWDYLSEDKHEKKNHTFLEIIDSILYSCYSLTVNCMWMI